MLQAEQVLQERYQLKKQLGNHAGRQTWLAEDLSAEVQQVVIIKLLPFSPQTHWDEIKLFEREAQVLKSLNHPRIPKYRDYFSLDEEAGGGLPWFALVQEYIPGTSLQHLLQQGQRFTEAQARYAATDILEILIYLHELSPPVFHRDIKPSNLILGKDKQFYLVDFGAVQDRAKAEGVTFTVVGTGGYAPPEQLWGRTIPASDLYALGATLIHLLTSTPPAELPQRRMRLQFRDRVSLDPSFIHWLEKLTEPAPERRFSQARQALQALQAINASPETAETENVDQKVNYLRIGSLAISQYAAVFLFAVLVPSFVIYRHVNRQSEARTYVGSINRAQQAYYLDNGQFSNSISFLGLGIKTQTDNYQYSLRSTPLVALHYATPRKDKLKSYVGGVFLGTYANMAETATFGIVCEAKSFGIDQPAAPTVQDGVLHCGKNTTQAFDSQPIFIGKDGELAFRALNYSGVGDYDKARSIAETIENSDIRTKVLEELPRQLATEGQYKQALQLSKTIEAPEVEAMVLADIAQNLAAKGQQSQAIQIFTQAIAVTQTLKDNPIKLTTLTELARKSVAVGQGKIALQILPQTFQLTQKLRLTNSNIWLLPPLMIDSAELINLAQQAYYLEQGTFANSLEQLGLDIKAQTKDYTYSLSRSAAATFIHAVPKRSPHDYTRFVGGVFIVPKATNSQPKTVTIVCQEFTEKQLFTKPTYQQGILSCGAGTAEISRSLP